MIKLTKLIKEGKKITKKDFKTREWYEIVKKDGKKVKGHLVDFGLGAPGDWSLWLRNTHPYRAKGISVPITDIKSFKKIKPFEEKPPKRKSIYF